MSFRQTRWLLRALIGSLWLGAAAAVGWAYVAGQTEREELVVATPRAASPTASEPREAVSFERLWDRPLRRPLVDPPPPPPPKPVVVTPPEPKPKPPPKPAPKPPPPPPKPEVELVGTIIEAERPLAILVDASGRIDMKGPGQEFDLRPGGVTLKSVDDRSAVVMFRDQETTLTMADERPRSRAGKTEGKANRRRSREPRPTQPPPQPRVSPTDILKMRRGMGG